MENTRIIVLNSFLEVGEKINQNLQKLTNSSINFMVPIKQIKFNNGEGKVIVDSSISDKDVYIICDVSNYSCTYKMYNFINHMSPSDHFQDLKRTISAIKDEARSIKVITPLLYQSRQDNHLMYESYDSVDALKELENLNVTEIITFDVHHDSVQEEISSMKFSNYFPNEEILSAIIANENINMNDVVLVSPDESAIKRAKKYSNHNNIGYFYKKRDLNVLINGKNPIIEHIYHGDDVKDKDVLIIDDIISSGETMLNVIKKIKDLGARNVYLIATFSLFTEGLDKFKEAYNNKLFNKVYSTNLAYVNDEVKNEEWFVEVDCSEQIAKIIKNGSN